VVPEQLFPGLGLVLDAPPLAAFAIAFAITPGIPFLMSLIVERRLMRPARDYLAMLLGDPALAVSVGVGALAAGIPLPDWAAILIGTPLALVPAVVGLGFGLLQWRVELRTGFYTRRQAFSPTKIYHQLVIYPVMGVIVTATMWRQLAVGSPLATAIVLGGLAIWGACLAWDARHPKLGHVPFDWSRGRPVERSWAADSVTLRVDREVVESLYPRRRGEPHELRRRQSRDR
jgi:hypothetical protein